MTEKIKELRDTLAHLHEQLENEAPIAVETRALLQEAMLEISEALERATSADSASTTASAAGSDEEPSLLDRLSQMAEEFEESHPAISAAMGRVATALSNLGI
jgi:biotin carboxylase